MNLIVGIVLDFMVWESLGSLNFNKSKRPKQSDTPDHFRNKSPELNSGVVESLKDLNPQKASTQRAQYPLVKEYGLNYIGLHIMI